MPIISSSALSKVAPRPNRTPRTTGPACSTISPTVPSSPTAPTAPTRPHLHSSLRALALCLAITGAALTPAPNTAFSPIWGPATAWAADATSVSGQSASYGYLYGDGIHGHIVTDRQDYFIYAGAIGENTEVATIINTNNASASNNTLSVLSGAGIDSTNSNIDSTSTTAYKINGAAAHIAIMGDAITVTATGNTATMNASFTGTENTDGTYSIDAQGYINDLAGAYISINYLQKNNVITGHVSTVSTLTASNNSVILIDGYVGYGLGKTGGTVSVHETGSYLAGAYVQSQNVNSDAQFILDNNTVFISGGTVASTIGSSLDAGALAGAYARAVTGNATMSYNSVTITGGDIQAESIMGAAFYSIEMSTSSLLPSGAYNSELYYTCGYTNNASTATMSYNSVTISGADAALSPTYLVGAYSNATLSSIMSYNTVDISNVTIKNTDGNYGSTLYSNGYSLIAGAYIEPATLTTIDADYVDTYNKQGRFLSSGSVTMNAMYNSVTIHSGTISGTVAGAAIAVSTPSSSTLIEGTSLSYNGTLSYNTVNIYGGTIEASNSVHSTDRYNGIFGGVYQGETSYQIVNNGGYLENTYSVTNNTVNIGFSATVQNGVQIGGGAFSDINYAELDYFVLTPNVHTYDGNTLNLYQLAGSTVKAGVVANFETINFVLGADDSSQFATDAVITISDTLYLGNGYATQAGVNAATSASATLATKYASLELNSSLYNTLASGSSVTLVKATTIDGSFSNLDADNNGTITGTHGAFLSRTWDIETTNGTMTATLKSTQIGEQAKVLGEVSLGGVTVVNAGADLLASGAISAAQQKMEAQVQSGGTLASDVSAVGYMVSSVGTSRYETGSHVDSNTISLNAGAAYGGTGQGGDWLLGGFLEMSNGSYSTYNAFSTGDTRGKGDVQSFGLGGFARFDFDVSSDFAGGIKPYAEASLRLGIVEMDFYSSDLKDYSSTSFQNDLAYDVSHTYMGAHLGLGGEYQVSDIHTVDVGLRYFWTHQFHDSKNLFGHNVTYHAVDSHRLRVSGRSTYLLHEYEEKGRLNVYGGFGLEYEFDGEARNTVDGYAADAPDLQGFTATGEMGFSFTPLHKAPLTVDLGVQGYLGKREGVGASMQLLYGF